ncbi:helix-turn-helix domain-containing protein [Actinomadura fibrosa]|uniref:Helix-turn-helix domain-containing protein n=1 Tax=Actinomadura fibrosa TaxID=111802 RepID=A0ABW2XW19_9ACTN|nr:helix-turn-helix transcriptional regulator [Actinomadura fibrosa]
MRNENRQTYRRRKIGDALREFREELGLTQCAASRILECSQASVSAYENGHRAIRPRDLKYILDTYGVTDELVRGRLLSLAAQGRQRGWWHNFEERFEPGVVDFASLEADASRILIFEPERVHGLLQTEAYAHAVILGSGSAVRSPRDAETEVNFRLHRQRLHEQTNPPRISVILGEGALRQLIGGPVVMREQHRKLLTMGERPHISLRVIPFSAGAHPGHGAFTILSVGIDAPLDVVAIDCLTRNWYIDEPPEIEYYTEAFEALEGFALSESDSRTLIERVAFEI